MPEITLFYLKIILDYPELSGTTWDQCEMRRPAYWLRRHTFQKIKKLRRLVQKLCRRTLRNNKKLRRRTKI